MTRVAGVESAGRPADDGSCPQSGCRSPVLRRRGRALCDAPVLGSPRLYLDPRRPRGHLRDLICEHRHPRPFAQGRCLRIDGLGHGPAHRLRLLCDVGIRPGVIQNRRKAGIVVFEPGADPAEAVRTPAVGLVWLASGPLADFWGEPVLGQLVIFCGASSRRRRLRVKMRRRLR